MMVELWQVPLLVMVALAAPVVVYAITGRRLSDAARARARAYGLLGLSVIMLLLLVVAVRALGSSVAANIATIASAVTELVILWLAYVSFKEQRSTKRDP